MDGLREVDSISARGAPILTYRLAQPVSSAYSATAEINMRRQPFCSAARLSSGYEWALALLLVSIFLPEGFSFFVGNLRLTVARCLLMILFIVASAHFWQRMSSHKYVFVPSDLFAMLAGVWMIVAGIVTTGVEMGLKGAGAMALGFTGAYFVFRNLPDSVDSSVRLIRFACKVVVVVVAVALLDTLTGTLFTYEITKFLTGYIKPIYESYFAASGSYQRYGFVRAMGPLEHAILFGTVCAWFGILAWGTFASRPFANAIGVVAFIGALASISSATILAYFTGIGLIIYYKCTKRIEARWMLLLWIVLFAVVFLVLVSRNPIATLTNYLTYDPYSAWYREALWDIASPVIARSPLFGIGLIDNSGQGMSPLGTSVDAMWLEIALTSGVPTGLFMLLTMMGAFWRGKIDKSPFLTREEQSLSITLGIVATVAVFIGITVDLWGACWILLGIFPGMRAHLAEAAILRRRSGVRVAH